jgi:hypothetical protein
LEYIILVHRDHRFTEEKSRYFAQTT